MARAPRSQDVPDAEALPEADRLGEFPHPRETGDLFGHEPAERMLAQALVGGRLHHAWLLAGRAGIGRATLAYRMARHELARPEERDPAAQPVDEPADHSASNRYPTPFSVAMRAPAGPSLARSRRMWTSTVRDSISSARE